MIDALENKTKKTINNYILLGIPFIFILSALFHFMFEATGKPTISAVFFPVNESIFEHLKLVLYPSILYFLVSFFLLKKDYKISFKRWFIALCSSVILSILTVLFGYYVFKYAFNIDSLIWHISILLIGTILGQLLAVHVYNKSHNTSKQFVIALLVLILLIIIFTWVTFNPPKLPLFLDYTKNIYGIISIIL
ncbi:MAG: hypothetical protein E7214_03515 [Clostridium sp.]|nr:hypothetical protein [Clostridium sp.]